MDKLEIQIFDEITNYKEKFGIFTVRQWLFVVLIAICVIPTYIFLPKLIGDDITSYVIMIEAALIGFIGFVPVHNLPAEKIIPYWIRHYFYFNKPLKYMTLCEYQELKESKKKKSPNSSSDNVVKEKHPVEEPTKLNNKELNPSLVNNTKEKDIQKTKKKLTKQEKALIKAKKKYGYLFKEDNPISEPNNDEQVKNIVEVMQENNYKPISEDKVIIVDVDKEFEKMKKELGKNTSPTISTPIDVFKIENQHSEEKLDKPTEIKKETSENSDINTSENDELNNKINSLSDEEKRLLLKLLGK